MCEDIRHNCNAITLPFLPEMENQNENQTSTSTNSGVPVEHIHFDGSQLPTASGASGSNESDTDQVSNSPGDVVAPLGACVIGDMDCEEDTRQQPQVCSRPQPSEHEDVSLIQPQDREENSHHYCCICMEYVYVQVNGSRQIAAHEACLDKLNLSHTDWNCFQRGRTVQSNEVLSLVCGFCKKEVVIMKLQCCSGKYHKECLIEYKKRGDRRCPYCRRPTQEGGGRNGGGEDDIGGGGGGSPSTSQPPQQLSYPQVLLLAHFFPELFRPHSGGDGEGGDGEGGDGGRRDGGRRDGGEGDGRVDDGEEGDDHEDGRDDDGDGGGSGGGSLLPVYHDLQEMEDSREILTNNQDDNEVATHGRRHTPVEGIHWDPH